MKNLIFLFLLLIVSNVGYSKNQIAATNINELYSPDKKINLVQKDLDFWTQKLKASPNQTSYLIKLAGAHSQLFSLTSHIEDLKKSENLLQQALATPLLNRSAALRALAHNYISQHRFCAALDLVLEAVEIGENKFANDKMLFDIYMELGNDEQARIQLTKITNNNNFDYLIRKSKWEDSKGNLAGAITHLERAKKKAIASNNKGLMAWIYSNLGDYYGHNGEIEKSYDHFKKTLELDPANWYALKGIAWIAYSNDQNIALSTSLLETIISKNNSPDLHLRLAELAEYKANKTAKLAAIENFQTAIQKVGYGDMYNKYACFIAAENTGDFKTAYGLANKEIINRPTTESYDLLAWTLFLDGKIEAAQKLAKTHILGKTSEPAILLHLAHIFQRDPVISTPILREIEGARFELGPLKTIEIKALNTAVSMTIETKEKPFSILPNLQNPFWFLG